MVYGLSGKKVLVTGAGRGIGRALCIKFNEIGLKVFALSKTKTTLDELKSEGYVGEYSLGIGRFTNCLPCYDWVEDRGRRSALVFGCIDNTTYGTHILLVMLIGASKAALDAICRSMALELGANNIRVNCVNPTVVFTDMGKLAWSDPVKSKPMIDRIPLKRFASEEEVVQGVLFLLGNGSSMTTGMCFPIDGGASRA